MDRCWLFEAKVGYHLQRRVVQAERFERRRDGQVARRFVSLRAPSLGGLRLLLRLCLSL